MKPALRWCAWVAAVAIIHFAAVRVGVLLDVWPQDGESVWLPFWLPAGTALASLLLLGWRYWPGILIGSIAGDLTLDMPLWTAAVLGAANAVEAVFSTVLIRRFVGARPVMATLPGLLKVLAIVSASAALISAPIGVWALIDAGYVASDDFWRHWWLWASGNVVGVLVAAPAPLALLRRRWRPGDFGNKAEAAVVVVLAAVAAGLFHTSWFFSGLGQYPLAFAVVPFLIWVAFRFGPEGTGVLVPLLSIVATVGAAGGDSPFTQKTAFETLAVLQAYIGISAVSAFILSALVSERKSVERALNLAKEEAERANRAKTDFLANMSHELRTPLNAILGFSGTIEHQIFGPVGDPRYQEYAVHIQDAGRHLLRLINGMLDLYKVESGGVEPERKTISIDSLIEEVATLGRVLAAQHGNTLTVTIADTLGEVVLDPTMTRQILLNILGNAAKYTEGGEIALSVEPYRHNDTDWIEFIVSDTGPGMSEEERLRIFKPFDRGNPLLSARNEGLGLGLAITADLCKVLQGKIDVESAPGEGTTFKICLPAA